MGIEGEAFRALLGRRAPKRDVINWFAAFSQPKTMRAAEWMELVVPVADAVGDLSWMTSPEKSLVMGCILDFIRYAFTELWNPAEHSASTVHEALSGFMSWIESRSDNTVVRFCWDLLAYDRSFTPQPVWWLNRSGRLIGAMSYDNIRMAVSVANEADTMFWWPKQRWSVVAWERDSPPYVGLLGHNSYLVRAAASMALGRLFYGVQTGAPVGGVPLLSDVLAMIQDREVETPGVAGPFLHGANWGLEPEGWPFRSDCDMKTWFIATLRQSGPEPQVPHIQGLEFYAHELFAVDANAVREFLEMGRKELAVMTATEEPSAMAELLPVLNDMAASDDPEVSAAIREYLASGSHHAGLHHISGRDGDSRRLNS